jgi:hypothetical protein
MQVFIYCHYLRESNRITVFLAVMTVERRSDGVYQATVQHGRRLHLTLEPNTGGGGGTRELTLSDLTLSSSADQDTPSNDNSSDEALYLFFLFFPMRIPFRIALNLS